MRIFKKRGSVGKGPGLDLQPAAPGVTKLTPADEGPLPAGFAVDEALGALHERLLDLPQIEVAQAAKERGWARLERELERRPVRPAVPAPAKGARGQSLPGTTLRPAPAGHARAWRLALGSTAAVVALAAVLLGVYGAGLLSSGSPVATVASNTQGTSPITGPQTTTPATGPTTTPTTEATTSSAGATTVPATNSPTTSSDSGPLTTSGPVGPPTTATVPSTTPVTQMAARQLELRALDVAVALGSAVLDGDTALARSLVSPSAQGALTQLLLGLNLPSDYDVLSGSGKLLTADTMRFTIEFEDLPDGAQPGDGATLLHPRFYLTVTVDAGGAKVTGISRAPES